MKSPETEKTPFADDDILERIIGPSEAIQNIKRVIRKVANSRSTVCLNGESGTGKELFARALHQLSDRRNRNFVPINCAAIPDTLLESELFGYMEGSFTGAKKGGKQGKFEFADQGTLFFDEIADLQLHLQAKLLRVLQEGAVEKIGGYSSVLTNVRVVTATNKELHERVEKGLFREDLFYRLNVIPIYVPSLRDRPEDILPLARHFLEKVNAKLGAAVQAFDPEVERILVEYPWPGNIRELEHVVEYAINMTAGEVIVREELPSRFRRTGAHRVVHDPRSGAGKPVRSLEDVVREEIGKALFLHGRSRRGVERAARDLGISPATLYRKIKAYEE